MASRTMFSLLRIHTISFSCCRACTRQDRRNQPCHAFPHQSLLTPGDCQEQVQRMGGS